MTVRSPGGYLTQWTGYYGISPYVGPDPSGLGAEGMSWPIIENLGNPLAPY